jgi:UDP:flavonoid glycosyltransferase YjiC (YdhE family)
MISSISTGQKLLADGHRVRLATHTCFRTYVEKQGLEFYPLAGDPHLLSDFMVKTNGCLIPTTADLLREVWCTVKCCSVMCCICFVVCCAVFFICIVLY